MEGHKTTRLYYDSRLVHSELWLDCSLCWMLGDGLLCRAYEGSGRNECRCRSPGVSDIQDSNVPSDLLDGLVARCARTSSYAQMYNIGVSSSCVSHLSFVWCAALLSWASHVGEEFTFTPIGICSGFLWVTGGTGGIYGKARGFVLAMPQHK